MTSTTKGTSAELSEKTVPLGTGPPTREELLVYYPAKFTWHQLKTFINSGDLGLLKRDKKLQQRYDAWAKGIRAEYGSIVNYLMYKRLRWGKRDTQSRLTSALDDGSSSSAPPTEEQVPFDPRNPPPLPPLPDNAPPYFTADTPAELISITQNDWPYSVPPDIEHTLIWTRVPIFHPDIVHPSVKARVDQDGLWGFTGTPKDSPRPSPSTLPQCLPALSEWGVTMDKLVRSPKGTEEEEALVKRAGAEVNEFIRRRWNEREWETAWFVNPPRLQSVPGLAHIHVFARHKSPEEIARGEY
ncbi:hypothetical protein GLOTRDRAFT_118126 [Gloeophyllum trabeum ATCC 11539]|uniref:Uncharacterized protein n=1 Tax=Gloeophyllum trabeum (strain ATCC 11539 / FP-39264 / Madison 617) TaxID=670483 RepID=S7RA09_GLOTA|nr:uncharacterized protein GLOTRDRAFT_118126 [Gloeophyllum trabeum ATCC 11539]EPQ51085.1 hypothetical protein GLOTRDRAFT_118126 [Gloeophyllum trabeum ATCC 11539]